MSVDREYRIRIQTVGDPSGAQEVTGALDKTTEATQEGTKATEKHTVGLHAMHRICRSLNDVVPGLGVACMERQELWAEKYKNQLERREQSLGGQGPNPDSAQEGGKQ